MSKIIVGSVILLFLCSYFPIDCREQYLNRTLESRNYSKFYIVVNAKYGRDSTAAIVILNNDLYEFLKTKDSKYADILVYREFVKEKISKNDPFSFTSKELNQLQTSFTHIDSSAYSWAKKGRSEFIHHYFYVSEELNYARLNHDVSPKSFTSIIKILFEWNYLMSTVEGGLSIEELDFCGKI